METNQLTFEHICFKYKGNDNQLFTDLDVTMAVSYTHLTLPTTERV